MAVLDIMLPFYGDPALLDEAVASVLAQDVDAWRLTVIDDAYPGADVAARIRRIGDPRVTYIRNSVNIGITANFNQAAALAQGERVVIMGGDDRMLPGYVGRVLELSSHFPDAAIVQPGVRIIDEQGRVVQPMADRVKRWYAPRARGTLLLSGEPLSRSLLRGNWMYFPSLAWRRDLVAGGFRPELSVVQDLEKILGIAGAGGSVLVDDEIVFEYRRHGHSLSAVTGDDGSKFKEERLVFAEAEQQARDLGWRGAARAARRHTSSRLHALTKLPGAFLGGRGRAARALLRHAFGPLETPIGAAS